MSKPIIQKITSEQTGRIIDIRYPLGLFYVLDVGVYDGRISRSSYMQAVVKQSKYNGRGNKFMMNV